MGISAALSFAVAVWNGEDWEKALKGACHTGLKVGGIAWVSSVIAAQLGRTGIEQGLRGATDWVVKGMGTKAASVLANSLRSGSSIYGAAATNHLSKLLRGNIVTAIVTTLVIVIRRFRPSLQRESIGCSSVQERYYNARRCRRWDWRLGGWGSSRSGSGVRCPCCRYCRWRNRRGFARSLYWRNCDVKGREDYSG